MKPELKMLVVDDEIELGEMIAEIFRETGFSVKTASGGRAALLILKRERFDVVISDVRMPEGGGIELLEKINAEISPIPKLFLCSAYSDLTPEQAARLGVIQTFPKPFSVEFMIDEVVKGLKAA